jgi:hypothetical protein
MLVDRCSLVREFMVTVYYKTKKKRNVDEATIPVISCYHMHFNSVHNYLGNILIL